MYGWKVGPLNHEAMHEGRQKSAAAQSSVERSTILSEMWCVSNTWLHKPNLIPQIESTSPYPYYDSEKFRKMNVLKSKRVRVVQHQIDPFCKILFIRKGTMIYHRKISPLNHETMHEGRQKSAAAVFSAEIN